MTKIEVAQLSVQAAIATSVTLCLLTSHIVDSKLRVAIDPAPANGLAKRSQVMVDMVLTLPVERLDNRIGQVSREQMDAISASLRPGRICSRGSFPSCQASR